MFIIWFGCCKQLQGTGRRVLQGTALPRRVFLPIEDAKEADKAALKLEAVRKALHDANWRAKKAKLQIGMPSSAAQKIAVQQIEEVCQTAELRVAQLDAQIPLWLDVAKRAQLGQGELSEAGQLVSSAHDAAKDCVEAAKLAESLIVRAVPARSQSRVD